MGKIKKLLLPIILLVLLLTLIYIHEKNNRIEDRESIQTNAGVENFSQIENKKLGGESKETIIMSNQI